MQLDQFFANEGFRVRFTERLQREASSTALANYALDEAGNLLMEEIASRDAQIEKLKSDNADLVAKTTADRELIQQLRERAELAEALRPVKRIR